jgi:hypothetical protein
MRCLQRGLLLVGGHNTVEHRSFSRARSARKPAGQIVRIFKERGRTERMYEDLEGELGLDHFEVTVQSSRKSSRLLIKNRPARISPKTARCRWGHRNGHERSVRGGG